PGYAGQPKFFRFAFLYAGFAFLISLVREAIKDMEDIAGDEKYGCRTMPIAWGIRATKVYTAIWLIVLAGVLGIVQVYIVQFRWWAAVAYCFLAIFLPVLSIFYGLIKAKATADYAR